MHRLRQPESLLVGLTLLVKLGVLGLGAIAHLVIVRGDISGPLDVLRPWNDWDAPHYLDLIVFGYRAVDPGNLVGPGGYRSVFPGDLPLYIVFYPLYPWLATAVNAVVNQPLVSAFVVSSVASLFVAPLLYRLVRHEEGPGIALRAAWLCLIFPTAFFLHIGYTEALFLALVLGSFLAARTDRWWLAGLLGALAALTRVNGLVLLLALPAEAATQWFEQPAGERRFRLRWLAVGLVLIGPAAYLGLNQAVYGDAFHFLAVQESHWFKSLEPPWVAIATAFRWFGSRNVDTMVMYGGMELAFTALGLAATVYAALRFRPSWFAWMAGNWLMFTSTGFLVSVPRYSLTLFPLFVAMALVSRRAGVLVAISTVSLGLFVYFALRFSSGAWAF
ncbi:MAG TPA: glycosyltransferase family 39 protein [Candidatus Limnocylindria bacterium]|nr:glycosyltransferase family 39 protein [Candidatus Limnocylindria bacterium]